MNACERIQYDILNHVRKHHETPDGFDWEIFMEGDGDWDAWDYIHQFREGYSHVTDIPSPSSRYYESQSVAQQLDDKTWVGYTYWYGGGKHGDPSSMPWMERAYFLSCREEMKLVQTFTLKGK